MNAGLSAEELDSLIGDRDHLPFLNSRNALYRELGLKRNPPSRSEALRLMADNPNLIKRPVAVRGGAVAVGNVPSELAKLCEA